MQGKATGFLVPPSYPARAIVPLLWLLALAVFPVWIHFDISAWDFQVYVVAIHGLLAGHDPYADAIAIQQLFHQQLALHPNAPVPYSYVYSPLTLPGLRAIGSLPGALTGPLYWLLYAVGAATQTWFGMRAVRPEERRYFVYFAPVAMFFPGLLANGIILGGNVAYLLYGIVLATALVGWRSARWRWFYLAVLCASCVKAPLLSLVVIPVFSARRQWFPAVATGLLGAGLFAMQPVLWPTLFRHYLQAVELQFSFNQDFGISPAGLLSTLLSSHGYPYAPASPIFYLCYALPILGVLFYLSRRFLEGVFSLEQWVPVLLVGVILLNPRLIEYDVAPLTIPLALIGWRFINHLFPPGRALPIAGALFIATNAVALQGWTIWKFTDGPLLVLFFAAGVWLLLAAPSAPGKTMAAGQLPS